jgi:hypothetical protein
MPLSSYPSAQANRWQGLIADTPLRHVLGSRLTPGRHDAVFCLVAHSLL